MARSITAFEALGSPICGPKDEICTGMLVSGMPPLLYSFRRCPYAMRARLALQVSQLSCELREVVLRDKPACMLSASPKGTVPVLIDAEGGVFEESLDIMLWALRQRDPLHWLEPAEGDWDQLLGLVARNDDEFKFHLDRYKYEGRHEAEEPRVDHRAAASKFLLDLEARLCQWPWLFGSALCLADAAIAPFVRQFANTDRSWFDVQPWPKLIAWLEDFVSSALLSSVMDKHKQWRPGDAATIFPRSDEASWQRLF